MKIRTTLEVAGESIPCVLRFRKGKLVWCREGEERAVDVHILTNIKKEWRNHDGELPPEAFHESPLPTPRYVDYYVQALRITTTHTGPVRARTKGRIYHPLAVYDPLTVYDCAGGGSYLGTTLVVLSPGTEVTLLRRAWIRQRGDRFAAWEYKAPEGTRCWLPTWEVELLETPVRTSVFEALRAAFQAHLDALGADRGLRRARDAQGTEVSPEVARAEARLDQVIRERRPTFPELVAISRSFCPDFLDFPDPVAATVHHWLPDLRARGVLGPEKLPGEPS